MKDTLITKISLEDFKKLNVVGLKLEKEFYLKDRENPVSEEELEKERNEHLLLNGKQDLNFIAEQMEGSYHKKVWKPFDVTSEVIENLAETQQGNYVVVCLAKEPPEDEIKKEMETTYTFEDGVRRHTNRKEAISNLRWNYCYMGQFSTTTCEIYMDIDKLYSVRNYYEYRTSDYFRIPKDITKVIYMISKE